MLSIKYFHLHKIHSCFHKLLASISTVCDNCVAKRRLDAGDILELPLLAASSKMETALMAP